MVERRLKSTVDPVNPRQKKSAFTNGGWPKQCAQTEGFSIVRATDDRCLMPSQLSLLSWLCVSHKDYLRFLGKFCHRTKWMCSKVCFWAFLRCCFSSQCCACAFISCFILCQPLQGQYKWTAVHVWFFPEKICGGIQPGSSSLYQNRLYIYFPHFRICGTSWARNASVTGFRVRARWRRVGRCCPASAQSATASWSATGVPARWSRSKGGVPANPSSSNWKSPRDPTRSRAGRIWCTWVGHPITVITTGTPGPWAQWAGCVIGLVLATTAVICCAAAAATTRTNICAAGSAIASFIGAATSRVTSVRNWPRSTPANDAFTKRRQKFFLILFFEIYSNLWSLLPLPGNIFFHNENAFNKIPTRFSEQAEWMLLFKWQTDRNTNIALLKPSSDWFWIADHGHQLKKWCWSWGGLSVITRNLWSCHTWNDI